MATQVAIKGAKTIPPPSPFGELLRRSKFAAYDPKIRQAYTAPASYIARGNWGLKRPIANKERHSSIVLRNFEEHAHYIEWDRASAQVDLVRRVEELNMTPAVVPATKWEMGLSPSAGEIDSEFVSKELLDEARRREERALGVQARQVAVEKPKPVDEYALVDRLPTRGPGGYGMSGRATREYQPPTRTSSGSAPAQSFVQYNIGAMSPREFNAYLDELRELRPDFLAYLRHELGKTQDLSHLDDEQLVMHVGRTAVTKSLHRFFLADYTAKKQGGAFTSKNSSSSSSPSSSSAPSLTPEEEESPNAPQRILGQPHHQAGLMYASPTKIETYFTTDYERGFILQSLADSRGPTHTQRGEFITTFAGLTAMLPMTAAGPAATPLIEPNSEEGLTAEFRSHPNTTNPTDPTSSSKTPDVSGSERLMRMTDLAVHTPPVVTGARASNKPIREVVLRSKVVVDAAVSVSDAARAMPAAFRPGSFEYASYLAKVSRKWAAPTWGGGEAAHFGIRGAGGVGGSGSNFGINSRSGREEGNGQGSKPRDMRAWGVPAKHAAALGSRKRTINVLQDMLFGGLEGGDGNPKKQ